MRRWPMTEQANRAKGPRGARAESTAATHRKRRYRTSSGCASDWGRAPQRDARRISGRPLAFWLFSFVAGLHPGRLMRSGTTHGPIPAARTLR